MRSKWTGVNLIMTSVLVQSVCAFNVDTLHPEVVRSPDSNDESYFGYSIALLLTNTSGGASIVVGAPRANSLWKQGVPDSALRSGAVFKCPLFSLDPCQELKMDSSRGLLSPLLEQQWLGGSIDVDSSTGLLVACAHRWVWKIDTEGQIEEAVTIGKCYQGYPNTRSSNYSQLSPLMNQSRLIKDGVRWYMVGQAGMSVHLTDSLNVLLGAPGTGGWVGSVIQCTEKHTLLINGSSGGQDQCEVLPPDFDRKNTQDLLGYSISSGKFFTGGTNSTQFLVSAPRAELLRGKAILVDTSGITKYRVVQEFIGSSMGEYFGAAVLAVDLDGDGLCEIVVGAPNFCASNSSYDEGRVDVYMNLGDDHFSTEPIRLKGHGSAGAKFGSSLSRLCDIDNDGFDDFAVGAPYEDEGRGVVYVFRGRPGGPSDKFAQRITARDIDTTLFGFGVSISRGTDIDDNGYPDLAIGAYSSSRAVLLRSQPVVTFQPSLHSVPSQLDVSTKKFYVQTCMKYRGLFLPHTLSLNITLEVVSYHTSSMIYMEPGKGKQESAILRSSIEKEDCVFFNMSVGQGSLIDYSKVIRMQMQYSVVDSESTDSKQGSSVTSNDTVIPKRTRQDTADRVKSDGRKTFCRTCPIVNPGVSHQTSANLDVYFSMGCGEDRICQSELKVSYKIHQIKDQVFVIGSSDTVSLSIFLENGGEPASLPQMAVDVPAEVSPARLPKVCHEQKQPARLICQVHPHPFNRTNQYSILLDFDVNNIIDDQQRLWFNVSALTSSVQTGSKNSANISLTLASHADLEISAVQNQEMVYITSGASGDWQTSSSSDIVHNYTVFKYLPSPLKQVAVHFFIPVNVTSLGESISVIEFNVTSAFFNSVPLRCNWTTNNSDEVQREIKTQYEADVFHLEQHQQEQRNALNATAVNLTASELTQPAIQVLHLNCSTASCVQVTCDPVHFLRAEDRLTVQLRMRLKPAGVQHLPQNSAAIRMSTMGAVTVLGERHTATEHNRRPDQAVISTLVRLIQAEKVSSWIHVVSCIAAVLLLAMVFLLLRRAGFFRRTVREKMLVERQEMKRLSQRQMDEEPSSAPEPDTNQYGNLFIVPSLPSTSQD